MPVENNWDSEKFLQQVCIKAGLPPTAWKDDAATLHTFAGEAIRGKTSRPATIPAPVRPQARFRQEELAAYGQFCRNNIVALLTRATPSFYLTGVPDGSVTGIVLSVRRGQTGNSFDVGQLSLRPGVPLQATLYALTQGAAQTLAEQGIRLEELSLLEVGVTVFYDTAMHGTAAEPHLDGIDTKHRSVMIAEHAKVGIAHNPTRSPEELLDDAVKQGARAEP